MEFEVSSLTVPDCTATEPRCVCAAVAAAGGGGEKTTRPQRVCVEEIMEILDSSESFLHWDRNLSELSEAGEIDCVLNTTVSDRLAGV